MIFTPSPDRCDGPDRAVFVVPKHLTPAPHRLQRLSDKAILHFVDPSSMLPPARPCALTHRAREHIADAEFTRHLPHIARFAFVCKARIGAMTKSIYRANLPSVVLEGVLLWRPLFRRKSAIVWRAVLHQSRLQRRGRADFRPSRSRPRTGGSIEVGSTQPIERSRKRTPKASAAC